MSDLTLIEQARLLRARGEVLEAQRQQLVRSALSHRYGLSSKPDRKVRISRAFVQLRGVEAEAPGTLISCLTDAAREVKLTRRRATE